MLNRAKLLQEIHTLSDTLFVDHSLEHTFLWSMWQKACQDVVLLEKIKAAQLPWSVAYWQDALNTRFVVKSYEHDYQIVAVDGSQIYPDKHQGIQCFLINIGSIFLRYAGSDSYATCNSEPFLFVEKSYDEQTQIIDIVNGKREEFEFKKGLDEALFYHNKHLQTQQLFLFDGSLIFWHLEGKDVVIKNYFLHQYTFFLEHYYKHNFLIAGYISLPKSKELVSIVRSYLLFTGQDQDTIMQKTKFSYDADIMHFLLSKGERSGIFENRAQVSLEYASHIRPYFFYMKTAYELVRIEIPGYIACSQERVDLIASLVMNQVDKGYGYPVALAEAHEQAVVKGADRDFFYYMLDKVGFVKNKRIIPSQKSLKKRKISV